MLEQMAGVVAESEFHRKAGLSVLLRMQTTHYQAQPICRVAEAILSRSAFLLR